MTKKGRFQSPMSGIKSHFGPSFVRTKSWLSRSRLRRSLVRSKSSVCRAFGLEKVGKQVVICGYPRAGTSLLLNMMSATLDGFRFAEFEEPADSLLWKSENWVSKMPLDVFNIPRLPTENIRRKTLYVILVIRDLRDVLTSVHPNVPDRYYCNYETRWIPSGTYPYQAKLTDKGIRRIHEAIHTAERVNGLRTVRAKYEDIINDCDALQKSLATTLQVEFSRPFSQFHMHPEKHAYRYEGSRRAVDVTLVRENKAVDTTRLGKWRQQKHLQRVRDQFTSHPELFALLREYGYEQDDKWFNSLSSDNS